MLQTFFRRTVVKRRTSELVSLILLLNPLLPLAADIQVDNNAAAAHQASLNEAANGVPIVEITAPSAGGVSMNAFTQYNVGQEGVILNNSADIVQTQLGGYIQGNPNFNPGQAANLIVNQVTSQSHSSLNGYTEVGGHQAGVIIANPNGISCDGCGFINTNKATLTTGTVHLNSQGLDYINVRRGKITINGQGLNTNNLDQADLISQAIEINADFHANKARIITGKNTVDKDGNITAHADSAGKPELAIHLGSQSSLFVNDIQLIATEKGVGVNAEGDISAQQFELTADGKIVIKDSATIGSTQDSKITSQNDIEVSGKILSKGQIDIDTAKAFNTTSTAVIYSGVPTEGETSPISNLNVDAKSISNQGKLLASGNSELNGQTISNNGLIRAQQTTSLSADDTIVNSGTLYSDQDLTLEASNSLSNSGDINAGAITIASQTITNEGDIESYGRLDLNAQTLNNQNGKLEVAGVADIDLQNINNTGGQLLFWQTQDFNLALQSLNNENGVVATASNNLSIDAQSLDNQSGKLYLLGASNALNVDTLNNQTGRISSDGSLNIQTPNALNSQGGEISTKGLLTIDSQSLNNQDGLITSQQDITLAPFQNQSYLNNQNGTINAGQTLNLEFDSNFTFEAIAFGTLQGALVDVSANQIAINDDWTLRGDLTLNSQSDITIASKLHTGGQFDLGAQGNVHVQNTAELKSGTSANLQTGADIVNDGVISAVDALSLSAGNDILNNNSAQGIAATELTLEAANQIVNSSLLLAINTMELFADRVVNYLDIESLGDIVIAKEKTGPATYTKASSLLNDAQSSHASINAAGDISIYAYDIYNRSQSVSDSQITYDFDPAQVSAPIMGYTGFDSNQGLFFPVSINDIKTKGQHTSRQTTTKQAYASFNGGSFSLASIGAGNNLLLDAGSTGKVENEYGRLTAKNTIDIYADKLINEGVTRNVRRDVRTDYFDTERRRAGEKRNFFLSTVNYSSYSACARDNVACYRPYYTTTGGARRYIDQNVYEVRRGPARSDGNYNIVLVNRMTGQGSTVVSSTPYAEPVMGKIFGKDVVLFVHGDADGISEVSDSNESRYIHSAYSNGPVYSGSSVSLANVRNITGDGEIKARTVNINASKTCNTAGNICKIETTGVGEPTIDGTVDTAVNEATESSPDPIVDDAPEQILDPVAGDPVRVDPLENFQLPTGGLFAFNTDASHPYLIETNPLLTNYDSFISSDYLFKQLDWDADEHTKRIGDGYYEMRLVEEAIRNASATGTLEHFSSAKEQYKYLMDNAVAAQSDLQLAVGMTLSKEQINSLNASMVWMEYRIVKGQKVLVPTVYIVDHDAYQSEGSFIGTNHLTITGGGLSNQGQLYGSEYLALDLDGDFENRGSVRSRADLQAEIDGDLSNFSDIQAARVNLDVKGDILHETEVRHSQEGDDYFTDISQQASITATQGDLIQSAGGNYTAIAASSSSAGNQQISAQDIRLLSQQEVSGYKLGSGKNFKQTYELEHLTSSLNSEGDLILNANNNIVSEGASLQSGQDLALIAEHGSVNLLAVENYSETNTSRTSSSGPKHNRTKKTETTRTTSSQYQGSELQAGGHLIVDAGQDINLIASQASAVKQAQLNAAGIVNIESLANTETSHTQSKAKSKTSYKNVDKGFVQQDAALASISAGEGLNIRGEQGIHLTAAELSANDDLILNAQSIQKNVKGTAEMTEQGEYLTVDGGNANVHSDTLALTNESWEHVDKGKRGIAKDLAKAGAVIETGLKDVAKRTGLTAAHAGLKGESMSDAYHEDTTTTVQISEQSSYTESTTTQQGSSLSGNNVAILADEQVQLTNTDVVAEGIVQIDAKDILLDAKADTHTVESSHSVQTFTVEGQKLNDDELQVLAAEDTKTTTTQMDTAETYRSSTISATIKADHTTLTGGLIANATINEDGSLNDQGNLNFDTNTISVNHVYDTDKAKHTGANLGVGSQTTVGGQNNGHDKAQTTLATLGAGNVIVGGQDIDHLQTDINSDITKGQETTKDLVTGGLDAEVSIDTRVFT